MSERAFILHHGGKWAMAKRIVPFMPEHRIYAEPFCGSCSVLFAKPRSFVEVVNDKDDVLVNVFRQLKENPLELLARVWATPYAQSNFTFPTDNAGEQAALAIAKTKQFYLGAQTSSTFSIDAAAVAHKPKANVWAEWHERILPAAARLKTVQILCEDALKTIGRFKDSPDAFIYIDPPYIGHEREYKLSVDYAALIATCHDAKAKIMVSEFERGQSLWPSAWRREVLEVTGRSGAGAHGKTKKNREYLVMNYEEAL